MMRALFSAIAGISHRQTQDQAAVSKTESSGPSIETLAIVVTALLSVGSYILQAKLARDAEKADKDHDRNLADSEKAAARAGLLLDRVREQQAELLSPCNCIMNTVGYNRVYLDIAIGFQPSTILHAGKQVQPPASPHVKVISSPDPVAMQQLAPTTICHKYTPEEIQILADDDSKRDLYTSAYSAVIVPRLRELSGIIRRNGHVMAPSISMTDSPMFKMMDAALGFPVTDFWGGNLRQVYFYHMAYGTPPPPPCHLPLHSLRVAILRALLNDNSSFISGFWRRRRLGANRGGMGARVLHCDAAGVPRYALHACARQYMFPRRDQRHR
jgi:hypothetical protein